MYGLFFPDIPNFVSKIIVSISKILAEFEICRKDHFSFYSSEVIGIAKFRLKIYTFQQKLLLKSRIIYFGQQ